jgi:hypothetical protein
MTSTQIHLIILLDDFYIFLCSMFYFKVCVHSSTKKLDIYKKRKFKVNVRFYNKIKHSKRNKRMIYNCF